jgi:hypothetical protein
MQYARRHKCSVTKLIENLARDAEYTLKYERMTAAQRKAYEQGASGLDNLDRGWIRPIQAKERSATTMKTALKPRKR